MLRAPVVAGQFYPADRDELLRQLEGFYTAADSVKESPAQAVLAPHAGYVYSGAVAAKALAGVDIPSTVILLGPNHQGLGSRAAVYDSGAWQTPLGEVAVNAPLAAQVCNLVDGFSPDPSAHRLEHSLEVMLPFLQYQRPGVQIVPIMLREHSFPELEQMGQMLAEVLAPIRDDVLILASSDMSHYEPAAVAKQHDLPVLDLLIQGRAQQMYAHVLKQQISMCGIFPATLMLTTLNALYGDAYTGELLEYTNSAAASGDYASVVGYAAAVFR
ncbi:MAG: AmmeMemoRadiSam system protein B [Desulfuromonadaceae bacterium]|nr:AmmeMemoRadiSam system protein B [Desulfuromonadaceae bacterium]